MRLKRTKRTSKNKSPVCLVRLVEETAPNVWQAKAVNAKITGAVQVVTSGSQKTGDKVKVRLTPCGHGWQGEVLKGRAAGMLILGVHKKGMVYPIDRRAKGIYRVSGRKGSAPENALVKLSLETRGHRKEAVVVEVLKKLDFPFWQTYLSEMEHTLPALFSKEVLGDVKGLSVPAISNHRVDLTAVPFVTIDGEDAKDFDDAVWAEEDPNVKNKGGWHVKVAIADVAWYVRPGTAVDKEALKRGNSVYFPDKVLPMLPEALCNEMCSLQPNQKRGALVCEAWVDKNGKKVRHKFYRALIRSVARLTYTEVQRVFDHEGQIKGLEMEIAALIGTYRALRQSRQARGVLDLDVPEHQVRLNKDGKMTDVTVRPQWESHQLIEEMMILANVAAAETLEEKHSPLIYRVHARPSEEKIQQFNAYISDIDPDLGVDNGCSPEDFNRILTHHAFSGEEKKILHQFALKAQSKAVYSPENIGHFGLSLTRYAHFTSPIRRYADLIVHRALISALDLGAGGLTKEEIKNLEEIALHISERERTAATAENEAVDRYVATFLEPKIGQMFDAYVAGVSSFGINVIVTESEFYGFVPKRLLGGTFDFDEDRQELFARHSDQSYHLGDKITVRLIETDPYAGNLVFKIVSKKAGV